MVRAAIAIAVAAAALVACGRPAEKPPATAPAPAATAEFTGRWAAVGTEPFWRVDIAPGATIALTQADKDQPISAPYVAAVGRPGGAAFVAGDLTISFSPGPCSDGMSEISYPWTAQVSGPSGLALKGCGYRVWSENLTALLPGIDACLAAAGRRQTVIWAGSEGGATKVRLDDGEPRECTFAGGKASFADTNGSPRVSERDPLFLRAPLAPAEAECSLEAAKPIEDAAGETIGWLTDDDSC